VPTIRVPFRDAWRGALTAAVLFALLQLLFPLYFKVFLHGNTNVWHAVKGDLFLTH